MIMNFSTCVLLAFFQVVFSQQPSGYYGSGTQMTAAQMWDPNTWIAPFYGEAAKVWTNYYKKAQEATGQLYKQWEATDPKDLFNIGMKFAQQAAHQAQKYAQAGFGQGEKVTKDAMTYGYQGAQYAQQEAQNAAATAGKFFTG